MATTKQKSKPKKSLQPHVPGIVCLNCDGVVESPIYRDFFEGPEYRRGAHETYGDCIRHLKSEIQNLRYDVDDIDGRVRDVGERVKAHG